MFQEKEKMEYSSCKAPEELKNRIWSSIELEKKKSRVQAQKWIAAAACFVGVVLAGNFMYQESAILKINETPISYFGVQVDENIGNIPYLASGERNKSNQDVVPLEIQVSENAHIEVSTGNLCMDNEGTAETKNVVELNIMEQSVVYWYIDEYEMHATCTVRTESKEYHYAMDKEDASWNIRLEKIK